VLGISNSSSHLFHFIHKNEQQCFLVGNWASTSTSRNPGLQFRTCRKIILLLLSSALFIALFMRSRLHDKKARYKLEEHVFGAHQTDAKAPNLE
jgi:hypothetical protein